MCTYIMGYQNVTAVCWLMHGIIIRTGIKCKKIFCYMHDSICKWRIVKKAKIF